MKYLKTALVASVLTTATGTVMAEDAVIKDGYFCYRSVSPILAGEMNIKIKFA